MRGAAISGTIKKHRRADHQVQPGVEHQVDLAHIVGGTRHQVAGGVRVVERHAFAHQAGVDLVARVAFQALADDLAGEVANELKQPADDLADCDNDGGHQQRLRVVGVSLQGVERLAQHQGNHARQYGIAKRADQQTPITQIGLRRTYDHSQRSGLRRSDCQERWTVNSAMDMG